MGSDFVTLRQMIARARERMAPEHRDYVDGGADRERTLARNRAAFDDWLLLPRALRDVREIDTRARILGRQVALPFFPTAIGSLDLLHPEGARATARAAERAGLAACIGCLARPGFAEIARSVDIPLILQLYVKGDADWLRTQVAMAEAAGAQAILVTVDSPVYGRRERDLERGFSSRRAPDRTLRMDEAALHQAGFDWAGLERLRAMTRLPLGLKGILHPADAVRAIEAGVDCIYVSNHGGRQLDSAPATIEMLPLIAAAVAGRAEIILDSGIRCGTDIAKALALGASSVGLGRLQAHALALGGEAGLTRMFALLAEELRSTMAMMGARNPADLRGGAIPAAALRSGRAPVADLLPRESSGKQCSLSERKIDQSQLSAEGIDFDTNQISVW